MRTLSLAALGSFLLISSATAQIGLNAGNDYGLALAAEVGSYKTKLEVGGGLTPILVYWNTDLDQYLKLYFSGTIGSKMNIALTDPDEKNRLGLKFGVSYNTIMKLGFGGGVDYTIAHKPYRLVLAGGGMVYPKAYDKLLWRLNEEEGTSYISDDISAPFMNFRPFVGITVFPGDD